MRYTGKDSKNALKVGGVVGLFLFNKAIPSLLITAVEVMGEEKDPQHLYNEGGIFVGKPATCAAGEPPQGTCTPKGSCSPGVPKKWAQGETSPVRGSPCPPLLEARLRGDL